MSAIMERLSVALADRYRIERELGAGGMATVYLAQDLKHRRQVAIKVLRPDLAAALGPDRFMQEIEIAARLQHPHILGVHDSGTADGFLYYVMPYVAGESLRERLARQGELPVHEAVRLLSEVADALGYAHQQGVVHRDIKPENVMVSGRHALVMDFGVAKAVSEASGRNKLTTMGVALGTPAYMAPEQASADPNIDHRVDIYALGVMGYELLAGRPPFTGASPQQVLAAHVTQAPEPVSTHRPTISPALAAIIMKALAKRPADRWQSAEEMLTQLEPLATPSGGLTPTGTLPTAAVSPSVRRAFPIVAAVAVGAIAVVVAAGVVIARGGAPVMTLGTATQISAESPGLKMQPSISSDGEWVAYVSGSTLRGKIYVSRVGGGRPIALTDDTVSVEQFPRFSPDGKQVLFLSRGGAWVAPAQGGRAEPLVAGPFVSEAVWSPTGDRIAFVRRDSLYVRGVEDATPDATPRAVMRLLAPLNECAWSPDAELLACTVAYQYYLPSPLFGNLSPSGIVTVSLADGAVSLVSDTASVNLSPVWASGRLLYFVTDVNHQRDIFSIAVTADGRARGAPSRVTSGLGVLAFGLARDGRQMVYTKYSSKSNIWSLPLNAAKVGTVGDAAPVTAGAQTVESMTVSRDGKWLLFDSDLSGTSNIFRIPVSGGTQEQLTRGLTQEFAPSLSPDGTLLAFHSFRTGSRDLVVMPLDGGPVQQVTATPGQESYPVWAPDGKSLHFMDQGGPFYSGGAVRHGPDGTWVPENPKIPTTFWVQDLSPDGRYFTGILADSVRPEAVGGAVAVVPVDGSAPPREYRAGATDGLVQRVQWHPDGGALVAKQVNQGIATFWSIPAGGGPWRMIARLLDPLRLSSRWDFAVDRTRLFFALDDRQSDLWVVEVKDR